MGVVQWSGPEHRDDFAKAQAAQAVHTGPLPIRLRKIAVYAMMDLVLRMQRHLLKHAQNSPFHDDIMSNVRTVRGEVEIHLMHLWPDEDGMGFQMGLCNVLRALIFAFDSGPCWAKIEIIHRDLDGDRRTQAQDNRAWKRFVQDFQTSLHDHGLSGVLCQHRDRLQPLQP